MVQEGRFRHDLYHRLNVINIHVPPLRSRLEDMTLLIDRMLRRFAEKYHRKISGFDPSSLHLLKSYHWPGNVRELSNIIERSVALSDKEIIHLEEIPKSVDAPGNGSNEPIDAGQPSLAELEKRYIIKLLNDNNDNKEKTAALLGINKSTLWRKLKTF